MFRLRGVGKRFEEVVALKPTDLTVAEGRVTVLIGPSGCGKSTMLRLLLGLIEPDEGTVLFDGEPLEPDRYIAARRRMGYVIQGGGLFPHMTARENVTLMAGQYDWSDKRIAERVDELVELTDFPPEGLDRYPLELSGGQQQRVSLMRALMLDPQVLLMDEPLGALDPMIRAELQDELREIFRTLDKTVVLVTHDMDEAAFFGDEIALMRDGEVLQHGPLCELLDTPADPFVHEFIRAQRSTLADVETDA
jgi:osmoprotectant transport system ATP-binding protein